MLASGKVIMFKTTGSVQFNNDMAEEVQADVLDSVRETDLLEKAMNVLDNMEDAWESNHNALEIRDDFHLLRHYLKRLQKV